MIAFVILKFLSYNISHNQSFVGDDLATLHIFVATDLRRECQHIIRAPLTVNKSFVYRSVTASHLLRKIDIWNASG